MGTIALLLLLALILPAPGSAKSPGFDCAAASSSDEKLICGDEALSELDGMLSAAYARRLKEDPSVKKEQVSWLRSRRSRCKVDDAAVDVKRKTECLSFEYRRRTALLSGHRKLDGVTEMKVPGSGKAVPGGRLMLRLTFTRHGDDAALRCLEYVDVHQAGQSVPDQTLLLRRGDNCSGKDRDFVSYEDYNFDGAMDLSVYDAEVSGSGMEIYSHFLFDTKAALFVKEPTFPGGTVRPEVDKERKLLITREGGAYGLKEVHSRWADGKFRTVSLRESNWMPAFCAEADGCMREGADDAKPGCRLLDRCASGDVQPVCFQYVIARKTFDESGALARSEEELADRDGKPVPGKVSCPTGSP